LQVNVRRDRFELLADRFVGWRDRSIGRPTCATLRDHLPGRVKTSVKGGVR